MLPCFFLWHGSNYSQIFVLCGKLYKHSATHCSMHYLGQFILDHLYRKSMIAILKKEGFQPPCNCVCLVFANHGLPFVRWWMKILRLHGISIWHSVRVKRSDVHRSLYGSVMCGYLCIWNQNPNLNPGLKSRIHMTLNQCSIRMCYENTWALMHFLCLALDRNIAWIWIVSVFIIIQLATIICQTIQLSGLEITNKIWVSFRKTSLRNWVSAKFSGFPFGKPNFLHHFWVSRKSGNPVISSPGCESVHGDTDKQKDTTHSITLTVDMKMGKLIPSRLLKHRLHFTLLCCSLIMLIKRNLEIDFWEKS